MHTQSHRHNFTDEWILLSKDNWVPDDPDRYFWHNFRAQGGLRLSQDGYQFCRDALRLTQYSISIKYVNFKSPTPKFLLDMDRFFSVPYYLGPRQKIVLFDKKQHFIMTMYNNDFKKFLDSHKIG